MKTKPKAHTYVKFYETKLITLSDGTKAFIKVKIKQGPGKAK